MSNEKITVTLNVFALLRVRERVKESAEREKESLVRERECFRVQSEQTYHDSEFYGTQLNIVKR